MSITFQDQTDAVKIRFVGQRFDEDWKHFLWNVTIGINPSQSFVYKTGVGHFEPSGVRRKTMTPGSVRTTDPRGTVGHAIAPTVLSVVETLMLDEYSGNMAYDDFCSELGYDTDSMKAFDMYRELVETKIKFRKIRHLIGDLIKQVEEQNA